MAADAPGYQAKGCPNAEQSAQPIDLVAISTIRTLTIDAVERAQSGHAGAPLGLAAMAYTLWRRYLRYDPTDSHWPNRDRFVLSNGHASMLLYALLHLCGVEAKDTAGRTRPAVSLDDIKNFRQLDSVCPGHPEYRLTAGVETTTGPLGQGVANSVGMAIAERWLEQKFNRPGNPLFDYNIYAVCSDGDLMEGISSEAASIAGHLKLSNLCWIYDDNSITIEGRTEITFTEDVAARFRAYGWATIMVEDANDCEAFARAVDQFLDTKDKPTLILVKSIIGFGSPHKQGTAKAHSDPLGGEESKLTKRAYGWPEASSFLVPDGVRERLDATLGARGKKLRAAWDEASARNEAISPLEAAELKQMREGALPKDWDVDLPHFPPDEKGLATREASGKALNALAARVPWLIGGAADLAPSTKTVIDGSPAFEPGRYAGDNFHYGVREHAMGAIANGMAVSGLRPYAATFLIFSDYMRPPTRLAALMGAPTILVFSHDSIALGQDGPTHQPIEQLAALRAIPDLITLRPCDANETVEAWRTILAQSGKPACLVLTRQSVPTLDRAKYGAAAGLARGAYVLADGGAGVPEVILIGTGSEVSLCVGAYEKLSAEGVSARVVSMPSWDLFEAQDRSYREAVLPLEVSARVAVEAGAALGWDRYAGASGEIIAMRSFGASAPIGDVEKKFGFTVEQVHAAAKRQLDAHCASKGKLK